MLIVKSGSRIVEDDKREIFAVLRERILFSSEVWCTKILQWALGVLKGLVPQMRSGEPSFPAVSHFHFFTRVFLARSWCCRSH